MAIKKKADVVPEPPPPVRIRTEERQEFKQEDAESQASIRERIMAFPAKTEDVEVDNTGDTPAATPVGGKKTEPTNKQIPDAIIGPPPSESTDVETDEQIDARLNKFQPRSEAEKPAISTLRKVAKDKNTLARTFQEKTKELEKQIEELRGKLVPEDELNRLREADKYVATQAVESLPKWKEYDKAIAQVDESATSMLQSYGIKTEILDLIKKRGGVIALSGSTKPAGAKLNNPDGSQMTESQWFQTFIYDKLDRRQQNQFDLLTNDAYKKQHEKETALAAAKSDAKKTLETEGAKAAEAFNTEANKSLEKWRASELPKLNFPLKLPEILISDTKEEKEAKQKQIDIWQSAEKDLNRRLNTVDELMEVRLKAAIYNQAIDELLEVRKDRDAQKARADKLQEQWDSIKDSRRLSRTPPPVPSNNQKPQNDMTVEERLETAGFK